MTHLYKKLLNQMGQKIIIYEEMINLLQKEWDCIIDYSLEDMKKILKKKENLALKIQVLEEKRVKVVTEISEKLQIGPENLTLRKILKAYKHPLNSRLFALRETLLEQINAILDQSKQIKRLVDSSSLSIKKSLVFLHRTQDSSVAPYRANGQMGEGKSECRMLSEEV